MTVKAYFCHQQECVKYSSKNNIFSKLLLVSLSVLDLMVLSVFMINFQRFVKWVSACYCQFV